MEGGGGVRGEEAAHEARRHEETGLRKALGAVQQRATLARSETREAPVRGVAEIVHLACTCAAQKPVQGALGMYVYVRTHMHVQLAAVQLAAHAERTLKCTYMPSAPSSRWGCPTPPLGIRDGAWHTPLAMRPHAPRYGRCTGGIGSVMVCIWLQAVPGVHLNMRGSKKRSFASQRIESTASKVRWPSAVAAPASTAALPSSPNQAVRESRRTAVALGWGKEWRSASLYQGGAQGTPCCMPTRPGL